MARLAYLLPPVTGFLALLNGHDQRARRHGLQSVMLGVLWPAALLGASTVSPGVTQAVWGFGGLVWLGALLATWLGRDPTLPFIDRLLDEPSGEPPPRA